ncbi:MAG: 3-hydroxyacyl-CoA dehydrogenase family protein [Firmicutes bacterium]|nr:3-hydroxyacyl-CoA dehydrogenase family protein [Bacillota bacterium]
MNPLVILGPGILGRSLARHAAQCGLDVRLVGRNLAHASRAREELALRWRKAVREGRLSEQDEASFVARLQPMPTLEEALSGADALLEALPEDVSLKQAFWKRCSEAGLSTVLPLTGSSSLPANLLSPSSTLGLQNFHLFVPVHRHRVVEHFAPRNTSPERIRGAEALAKSLGLKLIPITGEAGLPAARMGLAQGLEAMRLLEQGVAEAESLDALLVSGYGHPCGPLELSDRIGLDLRLAIADHLYSVTGEARFEPPALLRRMVAQGHLGRKSGRGFYHWSPQGEKR